MKYLFMMCCLSVTVVVCAKPIEDSSIVDCTLGVGREVEEVSNNKNGDRQGRAMYREIEERERERERGGGGG